jgi:hypothetical protein
MEQEVVSNGYDDEQHLHRHGRIASDDHLIEESPRLQHQRVRGATLLGHKEEIKRFENDALAINKEDDEGNEVDIAEGVVFVDHVGCHTGQDHEQ